jgi:hypothetical protein
VQTPLVRVTMVLPGDFRTVDEVNRDIAKNRKVGDMLLNVPVRS